MSLNEAEGIIRVSSRRKKLINHSKPSGYHYHYDWQPMLLSVAFVLYCFVLFLLLILDGGVSIAAARWLTPPSPHAPTRIQPSVIQPPIPLFFLDGQWNYLPIFLYFWSSIFLTFRSPTEVEDQHGGGVKKKDLMTRWTFFCCRYWVNFVPKVRGAGLSHPDLSHSLPAYSLECSLLPFSFFIF